MIRKETYPLEQILPLIGESVYTILDGDKINTNTLRLLNFKHHGVTCVNCGIAGSFFAKEKDSKAPVYHLNLYALKEGEEILMTRDHIIPLSKSGPDSFDNLQTMCYTCNNQKDNKMPKTLPKLVVRLRSLKHALDVLKNQFQKNKLTLRDIETVERIADRATCYTIDTKAISAIVPGSDLKAITSFDTYHKNFISIGTNVTIVHNCSDGQYCGNFYILNNVTGERLQIFPKLDDKFPSLSKKTGIPRPQNHN